MGQQNLVPNGDFELFDTCPTYYAQSGDFQLQHATGWINPTTGTSDYYNICNSTVVSVPNNWGGFQNAFSGVGYSGIYANGFLFTNLQCENLENTRFYREYIQSKLAFSLETGKRYKLSFYISLADTLSGYAVKNIGAYFTTNAIGFNCFKPIVANPQVISSDFVTDMIGWTKVESEFIAQGGEEYLTIGNFRDTSNFYLDTLCVKPNTDWQNGDGISYYYIDGITLFESEIDYSVSNVFTPNGDGINDAFFVNFPFEKIVITNRWGNVVFESSVVNSSWNGSDQTGNICSDGVYFYVIEVKKDKRLTGFIQLLK